MFRSDDDSRNWVSRIRAACARETNSVLELARLMAQARRAFPHGDWGKLWESGDMPFKIRKGQMLLKIGECVEGLKAHTCTYLPAALHTLYCLADLGSELMEQLISESRIHSRLSLQEAKALVAKYCPGNRRAASGWKLQRRLDAFAGFVREKLEAWSLQQREMVAEELSALTKEIRAVNGETATARETGKVRDTGAIKRPVKAANQNESIRQTL